MKILIINTSQRSAFVALVADGEVKAERRWQSTPALGQQLLAGIDEVLQKQGWQLLDLSRIAVHVGPGATSALRQGVVTAAMLAQATGIEIVGIVGEDTGQLLEAALTGTPQAVIQPDYTRQTTSGHFAKST